jgi:hypothetical protein|tara:strand:+ start:3497 stop:3688 length:192 start_codon:yes stop_codon:yes gene_type:complete
MKNAYFLKAFPLRRWPTAICFENFSKGILKRHIVPLKREFNTQGPDTMKDTKILMPKSIIYKN